MESGLKSALLRSPLGPLIEAAYVQTRWTKRHLSGQSGVPIHVTIAEVTASFRPRSAQEHHWITSIDEEEGVVLRDLVGSVQDGDVFWDVGANIGLVSCIVGRAAEVETVAFEPYPPTVQSLRRNLADNGLSGRSTVVEVALGAQEGTAELAIADDWDTKHSIVNDGDSTITVPVRRGDAIASELGAPDILKIDVEGAELDVLDGLSETIELCRKVYCEVHQVFGVEETAVRDTLRSRGLEVEFLAEDAKTTSLVATR